MKKIIVVPLVLVVAAGFVVFAASWHFSTQLLHPKPGKCNKSHFIYCDGAAETGLAFEDVSFKARDGITLRGWYFPAKGSTKAVIMVHGITADRHEMLRWARALNAAGFNLLLYDQRNHGKSDRSVSAMGMREKDDIPAAVDYLSRDRGITAFGLFGVSMGAATAIPGMAIEKRISAGIFEASFADLRDLLTEMARRDFNIPAFPVLNVTSLLFKLRGGIDMDSVKPEKHIGRIAPRPVLIIHCAGDGYIDPSHGERLFKAAGQPREIWRAGCKKHAEAWQTNPPEAERIVAEFFKKNIR